MNKLLLLVSAAVALTLPTIADGVPEPGLVMYGRVWDTTSLGLVTRGNLTWTIVPASGGAPVTVSVSLTDIDGRFCYRLRVPFETLLGSTLLSANSLATRASAGSYDRSRVWVNGTNVATLVAPAQPTFGFKFADRGVVERVDLVVALPAGGGGLAGLHLIDSDGDGVNDADELAAGTNPHDASDYLHFTSIAEQPDGTVELRWSAVRARLYSIYRTTNLSADGYSLLGAKIPGSAPVTIWRDTNAAGAGPYFYRVHTEP